MVVTTRRWLNRNVLAIGVSSLMADANYEVVLAVLPLFLILGLGAPVYALGLVEGVADGSSAVFKFTSGYFSDRMRHRKSPATTGYAVTAGGLRRGGLSLDPLRTAAGSVLRRGARPCCHGIGCSS